VRRLIPLSLIDARTSLRNGLLPMLIFLMKIYCMYKQYIEAFWKINARLYDSSVAYWLTLLSINNK